MLYVIAYLITMMIFFCTVIYILRKDTDTIYGEEILLLIILSLIWPLSLIVSGVVLLCNFIAKLVSK